MLRQGINRMIIEECDESRIPFFCWECITIELQNKDIDIIIRNEFEMQIFLKVMILELDSVNGKSGSLKSVRDVLGPKVNNQDLVQNVYMGYVIQKVRAKIGYEACLKKRSVKEHLLKSILNTYSQRLKLKWISNPYPPVPKEMYGKISDKELISLENLFEVSMYPSDEVKINDRTKSMA